MPLAATFANANTRALMAAAAVAVLAIATSTTTAAAASVRGATQQTTTPTPAPRDLARDNTAVEWAEITVHAPFATRGWFGLTATDVDELLLMSGDHYGTAEHDCYRAHSNGTSWELTAPTHPDAMRRRHHAMTMGPASIASGRWSASVVATGGVPYTATSGALSSALITTDRGATFVEVDAGARGPQARFAHVQVYIPPASGPIGGGGGDPHGGRYGATLLCGGYDIHGTSLGDCWKLSTTDLADGWELVTSDGFPAGGGGAMVHVTASAASPSSPVLVAMGGEATFHSLGSAKNDVWTSADGGTSWTRVTAAAAWPPRSSFGAVAHPRTGAIYVMGGADAQGTNLNDVWKSADAGKTWASLGNAAWVPRSGLGAAIDRWGCIVVVSGASSSDNFKQDVWASPPEACQHTF